MKTEFEVRILDISFDTMITKLEAVGAKRIGIFFQKRYTYDFTPPRKGNWIRLRSDGERTTLAIKEKKSQSIDGTKELEIIVSDFEDTNLILEKLGYNATSFQINFRIKYELDNAEIDLDKWPMIPPFMEIEGNSKDDVFKILKIMGISENYVTAMDVDTIYKENGIDLNEIPYLNFSDEEKVFINQLK